MADHDAIRPGDVPEDVFRAFVQGTSDFAIFALSPEGIISSWNPGARRIKGYEAHEVLGKHLSLFYPPADVRNQKPRYVLRRAEQDGRFEDEGWRIRKDGTMFWANAVVTALRAQDGSLRGFVKLTRDLTERRHGEEALRQSEERHRLLVESVKDYAIFILDTEGHVMSWNAGAQRLKGYTADQIIGRHFSTFYTQPDRDRHHPEEELVIAVREGRYEEEGWRVRNDGTTFWANVTITPLYNSEGRHIGFAKVTRDLTERKRVEEQLRERASSYAELNRELDSFSHSVAHDLRAPVRAIHHLSDTLLRDAAGRLTPDDKETLGAIRTSAGRMTVLIQDLLDLSLSARREPERARVDVTALARALADELQRQHPEQEADVRVQEGLVASADESLLRLALANLLDNAWKYARGRTPAVIEVGKASTPRGEAFFVRDNGVGFDPARAAQLFQPFVRLHAPGAFEGTGVGLTIVQRIVRRHGGDVWAEGTPGKGATFFFTLGGAESNPSG